ncbi:MAG TPA: transglycosylase domain-containing protein [Solirubrobacteraceae bacterium]|jgi:penicillin-binding protein 1A|nr:transglycosylase domain-containing protein [Solirubrobacteraceae bacterium]
MSRRERQRRHQRKRGHPVKRAGLVGLVIGLAGIALAVMGLVGWVVATADSAPNISQLKPQVPGQVSTVYAANGTILGYVTSDILRTYVPYSQLPTTLRRATVAIEDRRFWHHGGVDYMGILRAGIKDVLGQGNGLQGGSTLTMQLVDNVYLPRRIKSHHNIKYKIIQAKLANELQGDHSRQWILEQYLNDVDYGTVGGQTAIGVGAASRVFFDKPIQKLDLAQFALLAGLPQAPSQYNPFTAPALARARRNTVLQAMANSGYVTQAQADAAARSPLQVKANTAYDTHRQPYVFDYVRQQLTRKLGYKAVHNGGLKIYTTINLADQSEARRSILAHEGEPGDPAAALVSIDPSNGHILAMAQSTQYGSGKGQTTFDYATQANRQTGSSFKPFVMMTMMHDYDGDPNSTYYTSKPLTPGWLPGYPTYSVHTAEESYQGSISVTKAMTVSDNTVFAQLGVDLGMSKVDRIAHQMGITSPLFGNPSEAIGGLKVGVSPLQMSDAYATLANGGSHISPTIINKVVFPNGHIDDLGAPKPKHVFSDGETYTADQVLKTVITSGTGTAANYGCPAAGKTGTTSNYTDAWFVGYTPKLSTAVWVGYPTATTSMNDVNGLGPGYGGTLAAPIWHDFMQYASHGYCSDFPPPTTPWQGVAYHGAHASGGSASTSGTSTSGYSGGATANPYTNTTLYSAPPQTAPTPLPPAAAGGGGGGGGGGTGGGTTGGAATGGGKGNGGGKGKHG